MTIEWNDRTRYADFDNAIWVAKAWCEFHTKNNKRAWIQDEDGDFWMDGTPPIAFVGVDRENRCVYATLPGFQGEKVCLFQLKIHKHDNSPDGDISICNANLVSAEINYILKKLERAQKNHTSYHDNRKNAVTNVKICEGGSGVSRLSSPSARGFMGDARTYNLRCKKAYRAFEHGGYFCPALRKSWECPKKIVSRSVMGRCDFSCCPYFNGARIKKRGDKNATRT